ncbi:Uma2 family endonuclease [Methylobacterium sp. J-048]|uniref:Uma2 family endonuclease n=1 Tax=Methylobacterium sp. J-048 TaxID=2836635 RepID=UPI001FB99D42|nr:Uma2 family endonuclease [Methylobacterium sp. J-048]MCJ2054966.1 Uma2 family endonuclease [Methylobacterium sp. J-048]
MTAFATRPRPAEPHVTFQDFVAARPDEEKWELIEGCFVMQAQPSIDHQIIGSNLDRLLNDALERTAPGRIAVSNPAIDLSPTIRGHTYVPDVAVIDVAEFEPGQNVVGTLYLAVEIISPSDRLRISSLNRRTIDVKLAGYEALPTCEAVLLVEQRSFDVTLSERAGSGWTRRRLTDPDDRLVVASAGLDCRLGDLYARTTLVRARR